MTFWQLEPPHSMFKRTAKAKEKETQCCPSHNKTSGGINTKIYVMLLRWESGITQLLGDRMVFTFQGIHGGG